MRPATLKRPTVRPYIPRLAFFLFLAIFLFSFDAMAKVSIIRSRIGHGGSLRLQRYTWGQMECMIENTDAVQRTVLLRVIAENSTSQRAYALKSLIVPPKSQTVYRDILFLENSDTYNIEAFVNGNRIATKQENSMLISLMAPKDEVVAVLNDDPNSFFGEFTQLPSMKGLLYPANFPNFYQPDSPLLLKQVRALVILRPDHSKLSPRTYQAIRAFAANGGTVIFGSPQGVLEAMKTPLADLIPVVPVAMTRKSAVPELDGIVRPKPQPKPAPKKKQTWKKGKAPVPATPVPAPVVKKQEPAPVPALSAIPKAGGVAIYSFRNGDPILYEMPYGLGVVRFTALAPDGVYFKSNPDLQDAYYAALFRTTPVAPDQQAFSEPLDQLTGFPVPGIGTVQAILFCYFGLLVVLAGLAFFWKRAALAWCTAVLAAVGMTGYILSRANASLGKRGSLMAVLKIDNRSPVRTQEEYAAFFAAEKMNADFDTSDYEAKFTVIPPPGTSAISTLGGMGAMQKRHQNAFRNQQENALSESTESVMSTPSIPIEFHRTETGREQIKALEISARTSKQFMEYAQADIKNAAENTPLAGPEIEIRSGKLVMKDWQVPGGWNPDSAFLVFPGSAIPLQKDGSRLQLKEEGGALFLEPLTESLRKAMESGYSKPRPYVAMVEPETATGIKTATEFNLQGKRITIVPANLVVREKRITLPRELLLLSPDDSSSRALFRGNRIEHSIPNQNGFGAAIRITIPEYLPHLVPEKLTLTLNYTHSGNSELVPKLILRLPGGEVLRSMKAKELGAERYVFEGQELKSMVRRPEGTLSLQLESRERRKESEQGGMNAMQESVWTLQDVALELTGSLPDSALPVQFGK